MFGYVGSYKKRQIYTYLIIKSMDACNHFGFVVEEKDFLKITNVPIDFVYVFLQDGSEWEDLVLLLSKEDAIQKSIDYKHGRVELFRNSPSGYIPTYNYYKNGQLILSTKV